METKCCGTCKRWIYVHTIEAYICDNADSQWYVIRTSNDHCCEKWEEL